MTETLKNTQQPSLSPDTEHYRRTHTKGKVAAVVSVLSLGLAGVGVYAYHEHKVAQREAAKLQASDEKGISTTLTALGVDMSHMTLKPEGSGFEAIYSDPAEGPDCKIGFNVEYENNNPSQPFLQNVTTSETTSKSIDNKTGVVLGHANSTAEHTFDITNGTTDATFFNSITTLPNTVCK